MLIFGVSFESVESNAAFAKKFEFPFRLLCDTDRKLGLAYRACERKEDQYPRRITYVVGADGEIEHAVETQSPAAQADELLAYFAESGPG